MKTIVKKSIKSLMAVAVAFVGLNTVAYAGEVLKRDTVFAIENMDAIPFPMGVFGVNADGTLTRQDTINVPTSSYSAVGLAVSTKNKLIFASHEFSDTLDVIDGETGAAPSPALLFQAPAIWPVLSSVRVETSSMPLIEVN